ncbi:MAG: anti-sigma factor family protein [Flammeovirgaceae bacterium]
MKYKPDEAMLMAYLYGELSPTETEKVQAYLQQHPDELAKLQSFDSVRDVMAQVQTKEVIAPPIIMGGDNVRPLWQATYVRVIVGIAASLFFLMVAGRILGTEIGYQQGELKISFSGKKAVQPSAPALSEAQVQSMIEASLEKNNQVLTANWNEEQQKLSNSIASNLDLNSRRIDGLMKTASQASQEQVRTFVASLQSENLKLMKDYFKLSTEDQKKYMEGLLVDFSDYLKEQRKQDLMLVQTRVASLEKNTDQFKQKTEQILASIISTPISKNRNSY